MAGLARLAPSLRPNLEEPTPSLPRRVLRHLTIPPGLGVGSRVIVGGDGADRASAFFTRLGITAEPAGIARLNEGHFDAAVWLDLEPAPTGDRSLLSRAALGRTAGLLATLRPFGSFLLVGRIDGPTAGHEAACLRRHLTPFLGRTRLAFFADRTLSGLFGNVRQGYAVASWQASTPDVAPTLWRQRATTTATVACCAWAESASRPRKAA